MKKSMLRDGTDTIAATTPTVTVAVVGVDIAVTMVVT